MKYRKKPVIIEAVQFFNGDGPNTISECMIFARGYADLVEYDEECYLLIETLEGNMRCNTGDWIIKEVKGEVYPCKPDIFAATYEKEEVI